MAPTAAATMDTVLHSFTYAIDYACDLLADLGAAEMVAQPLGVPNHPAWTVGHLTFVCQQIGKVAGLAPWLPDTFRASFGGASGPVADVGAYEPKDAAVARLRDAAARLAAAVRALDDAALDAPFPAPAYLEVFPTVRHAFTQVLVGHTSFHVGQLGAWRRAMGKPSIGRSFE